MASAQKSTKKLVVISAAFPPIRAGESDHALQLCQNISATGIHVDAITTYGCVSHKNDWLQTYPVMRKWSWAESLFLCMQIRRLDPAAILLVFSGFLYNNEPMITFAPTFIKRFVKKVPFVTQMEIIFPPIYDDLEKRASRKLAQLISGNHSVNYGYGTLLRDSDRIITLCPAHSENFISLYPQLENKMEIIPPPPLLKMVQPGNGYNKANVRRKLGVVGGEFLIAFFGYADHNKGIDTLFKAFKQIRSANQRVRLLMIGGGIGVAKVNQVQKKAKVIDYENMLLSLPSELGIKDAVIWPGGYSWDSEDASELLWASDICVLPFIEGATMSRSSLSAAMAHRLPVITTLTERVEAPLVHKENVYLIPPKDPSVLSDAVLELMGDENLRNRLIAGAERLAAKWFSWNGAIEKTLRCLNLN